MLYVAKFCHQFGKDSIFLKFCVSACQETEKGTYSVSWVCSALKTAPHMGELWKFNTKWYNSFLSGEVLPNGRTSETVGLLLL